MIGFDFARTFNPPNRLGTATGIVNVGGFVASLLAIQIVGLVLDRRTGGATTFGLADFRAALSVQYLFRGVGVLGVLRIRRLVRRRMAALGVVVPPLRQALAGNAPAAQAAEAAEAAQAAPSAPGDAIFLTISIFLRTTSRFQTGTLVPGAVLAFRKQERGCAPTGSCCGVGLSSGSPGTDGWCRRTDPVHRPLPRERRPCPSTSRPRGPMTATKRTQPEGAGQWPS